MISELAALNRTMMLSIDVIPVPTDEAVREMQNRLSQIRRRPQKSDGGHKVKVCSCVRRRRYPTDNIPLGGSPLG